MPAKYQQTVEHKSFTIGLTKDFKFQIIGEPYGDRSREYEKIAEARDEIDRHIATTYKAERVKIAMPAISWGGEDITVKGIHAVTGDVLPKSDGDIFPAVDWVRNMIKERVALETRMGEIRKELYPYAIRHSRAYGRLGPEAFDSAIQSLEHEIKEKTEKARKRS